MKKLILLIILLLSSPVFSMLGTGVENDPFIITNCVELYEVRNYLTKYFVLGNDIDCYADTHSGGVMWNFGKGFIPLGRFYGVLDGQNHSILSLHINRPINDSNPAGLFSNIQNAVIKNLTLDVNVTGNSSVGGLTGYSYQSTLENIFVRGFVTGRVESVGGVVGKVDHNSIIINLQNSAKVDGNRNVGGIVGESENSSIIKSSNQGEIKGMRSVGGIAGAVSRSNISSVYNSGKINSSSLVGGIAGTISYASLISSSYNTGNIIASGNYAGGIIGHNNVKYSDSSPVLINSYNTGDLTGQDYVGGLGGEIASAVKNSFTLGKIDGVNYTQGNTGGYYVGARVNTYWFDSEPNDYINYCHSCTIVDSLLFFFNRSNSVFTMDPVWNDGNWVWSGIDYPKLCWQLGVPCVPFVPKCIGSFENASLINGEDIGLTDDVVSTLAESVRSGSDSIKCEWACYSKYHFVRTNGVTSCVYNTCKEPVPENAVYYPGDNIDITLNYGNTSFVYPENRSDYYCEMKCNPFSYMRANPLYPNPYEPQYLCTPYVCYGNIDSNAIMYSNENVNLDSNLQINLVDSNTSRKCEYYCRNGFYKSGNTCLPFQCTGSIDTTSHTTLCQNDNSDLPSNLSKMLVSSCDSSRKCQYTCENGYYFSIVDGVRTCLPNLHHCTGTFDGNSEIYEGDNVGLDINTPVSLVDLNSELKCEYHCKKNFILNSTKDKCILNPFVCTDSNFIGGAVLYTDDNVDLISNTVSKLVDSNTSAKCEYYCKDGYYKGSGVDENKCLPNRYYCTGTVDSNAIMYDGESDGIDSNLLSKLVDTNTSRKCEWHCKSGFTRGIGYNAGKCILSSAPSCKGSIDPNAKLFDYDDENISIMDNQTNILVNENTDLKCEWHCKSGYYLGDLNNEYVCLSEEEGQFSCEGFIDGNAVLFTKDNTNLDSNLTRVLVDSNTSRKCEYYCKSGYYLGSVSGVGVCLLSIYSCKNSIPGAVVYLGDDSGLTSDFNAVLVEVNTPRKCEYHCARYYTKVGDACVLNEVKSAVCGNAEKSYTSNESFPSSYSLCSVGVPSVLNPVLNNELGSVVEWVCVSDTNVNCYATRVSSPYVAPDENDDSSNSIVKLTSKVLDDGNIEITLKCSKYTLVDLNIVDYLTNESYYSNSNQVDCTASESTHLISLESVPSVERSLIIRASLSDSKTECVTCKLDYFMDYVPSEGGNADNFIWFVIFGVMLICIIGAGAFFVFKGNFLKSN